MSRHGRAHRFTGGRKNTTRGSAGRGGLQRWPDGLEDMGHASRPSELAPSGAACCLAACHFHEKATRCQGGSRPEAWPRCVGLVQVPCRAQTTSPPRFHTHSEWVSGTRCTVGSVPYRGCHLTSGLDEATLRGPSDNLAVPRTGRKVEKVGARWCMVDRQAAWLRSGTGRSGS